MTLYTKLSLAAPAVVGALALMASPAQAQDERTKDALIGAAVGGVAGALLGNGDRTYIAGGALAGAALGASASNGDDCGYRRGGRCYRNQGHWEREHGINSRDYNSRYAYDRRAEREWRREERRERRQWRRDRDDD